MDKLDFQILQELQEGLDLKRRPFDGLVQKLGISCARLLQRIDGLLAEGIIRRLGAGFDSKKLGFCSTLAAVSVRPELAEKAASIIGQFTEVTHCYLRDDDFNIWFTIIAADNRRLEEILEQIGLQLSLDSSKILNLPAKRQFKLDTRFIEQREIKANEN